jgi:hypothetical protein
MEGEISSDCTETRWGTEPIMKIILVFCHRKYWNSYIRECGHRFSIRLKGPKLFVTDHPAQNFYRADSEWDVVGRTVDSIVVYGPWDGRELIKLLQAAFECMRPEKNNNAISSEVSEANEKT